MRVRELVEVLLELVPVSVLLELGDDVSVLLDIVAAEVAEPHIVTPLLAT